MSAFGGLLKHLQMPEGCRPHPGSGSDLKLWIIARYLIPLSTTFRHLQVALPEGGL